MNRRKTAGQQNTSLARSDFDADFLWGVSCSAPQIEGAAAADGKGNSIWDVFAKKKNKILHNDSPEISCDFYHHYKEDIALIKHLGIPNFRISIAWSRILPNGTGHINQPGIDFYHRVIDTCLEMGIEPWITLYHWDLPQALEEKGGWTNRKIVDWFEEYVRVCVNHFHPKVNYWMVLNEPMVFTGAGYFLGVHAPGKRGTTNFLAAMHHAVLCQAVGCKTIKSIDPSAQVGTTFSCSFITPYSNSKADLAAAARVDALLNRTFIEPSLGLGYPEESLPFLKKIRKFKQAGDDVLMQCDFDFIGIQNYTREVVRSSFYIPFLKARIVTADKRKVYHTLMDWEVYPEAIYQMVEQFSNYKKVRAVIITENGASFPDERSGHVVKDDERVRFIAAYLEQVARASKEQKKLKGYFVWSLTDNFEWAEGYRQRFGLVYIDFKTQERVIKDSGYWYKDFLAGTN